MSCSGVGVCEVLSIFCFCLLSCPSVKPATTNPPLLLNLFEKPGLHEGAAGKHDALNAGHVTKLFRLLPGEDIAVAKDGVLWRLLHALANVLPVSEARVALLATAAVDLRAIIWNVIRSR